MCPLPELVAAKTEISVVTTGFASGPATVTDAVAAAIDDTAVAAIADSKCLDLSE